MFVFATVASSAYALDPRYAVSQYVHTAWTEQGGAIRAGSLQIAQTTDGFIWLAGEAGVVRFDGVRFVPWAPPGGRALGNVQRLLASPDGSLWFGTMAFAGTHDDDLFRWRDGEWIDYGARNRRGSVIRAASCAKSRRTMP
jgi:ligand-binding sensor domain-containing protein